MLRIAVKVVFDQPFHIGTGGGDKLLPVARDVQGRPCIPASTLKGSHRATTEQFAAALGIRVCTPPLVSQMCQRTAGPACPICQIFGAHWLPGIIRYRDLLLTTPKTPQIENVARAPHSRRRRVMLRTDTIAREIMREGGTFAGQIDLLRPDFELLALTLVGLRSISVIGAASGIGRGLCRVEAEARDLVTGRAITNAELAASLQKLKSKG